MAPGVEVMLQVLQIIIALPLLFFVPGYFLTSSIFRKKHHLELYEKVALSILCSLGINIIFGLALASAGRFTAANLWMGAAAISALLIAAYSVIPRPHSYRSSGG